ncbi:hypothetical protein HPB49_012025 [Dermacentor silvarum]|uniref:Uncharacterized protein n=1 Tax=Dermacentor silvarum TaxID=543639 RepID=A0ACB8D556_DERSI|nr:hypothetical protein HPB49_012025 [Dermacentor silvarum]
MRTRFFVSGKTHEEILRKFPRDLCHVVSVTSQSLSAPADHFPKCSIREEVSAGHLFSKLQAPHKKFPRGQVCTAVQSAFGASYDEVRSSPEALALISGHMFLNNTITIVHGDISHVHKMQADLTLLPISSAVAQRYGLFMYAQYPPAALCVFSLPRRAVQLTFIDSRASVISFCVSLVVLGCLVAMFSLASSHFGHSVMRRRFSSHSLVIYLVSTLLGRCPPTSVYLANRSLATAFWALAMLALGNYVQTSITAIRSVPFILSSKSFAELTNDLKNGTIYPCLSTEWYEMVTFRRMLGVRLRGFLSILNDLASHPKGVTVPYSMSLCYKGTQSGIFVAAFSMCTDDEVITAAQCSLIPGELTFTCLRLAGLHPENPLRYQHRRLLQAIAEGGLSVPHRRLTTPVETRYVEEDETFRLLFTLYGIGCAISFAALAIELGLPQDIISLSGGFTPSVCHGKIILKIVRTERLRQARLHRDYLSVQLFDQYEPCVARNLLRRHLHLADQVTEFLWQPQLRLLRAHVNKDRQKATVVVHVPEGLSLPNSVGKVLGLGPKFAHATSWSKPELLSVVREVSKRAPEEDGMRMNSEGLDALLRCKPQPSKLPVKRVESYLKSNSMCVTPADKEGSFAVFSYKCFSEKAGQAIYAVFNEHKEVSLAKVAARANEIGRNLNLDKLRKSVLKSDKRVLDVFFNAKTHKEDAPFRVIISERGTWQNQVALYLLSKLNILEIDDHFRFRTRSHRRLLENVAPTHSSTMRVATTQLDVAGSVDKGLCDSSSASPSATTSSSEPTHLTE